MNSRKTFALIDLSAYRQNLVYLSGKASPAKLMVVVKADAYGHGAVELSKVAQESGVDRLAVAFFLEEGIKIRKAESLCRFLCLTMWRKEIPTAKEFSLTLSLSSFAQLEDIIGLNKRLPDFQLVVDTGMRRLGLEWEESIELYNSAVRKGINITGAYTHFATADEKAVASFLSREKLLEDFFMAGQRRNRHFETHISNSAGTIYFDNSDFSYVRAGIATYGLQPSKETDENLKPIFVVG